MNFPQNLKYTNEHEWIRVEGDIAYVNKDPYGEGWLIKMKPADASAAEDLLDAEAYKAVVNG